MSEKPTPAVPRPAATILLVRDAPAFEVLMVKRSDQIAFAGGALVFPGGKTNESDRDDAWAGHALNWNKYDAAQREIRIAGIREVFEEAGLLMARRRDGSPVGADALNVGTRRAVDKGEKNFLEVVMELDAQIDLESMSVLGRWITPPIAPKRFDTWFLVAKAPEDQLAVIDDWETVDLEWIAPAEAVRLGEAGERAIILPTRMNLKRLAQASSCDEALAQAAARPLVITQTRLDVRPEGKFMVLPEEGGYGYHEELLDLKMIPAG